MAEFEGRRYVAQTTGPRTFGKEGETVDVQPVEKMWFVVEFTLEQLCHSMSTEYREYSP
jgi:hypothetical protein